MLCSPVQTPASTHASANKLRCTNRTGLLAHTTSDSCETVLAELGRHDHGRRHRTYKRYGRALGSSPLRGQHNSKQNYFPVVYFFRTATKPLTCIVQEPGHLGHRTVKQCIAQVSGEPQCLICMSWQCLPAWPRGAPALEP